MVSARPDEQTHLSRQSERESGSVSDFQANTQGCKIDSSDLA